LLYGWHSVFTLYYPIIRTKAIFYGVSKWRLL